MRRGGAERWFTLCERLCRGAANLRDASAAGLPPSPLAPLGAPLSVRLRRDTFIDVIMADSPAALSNAPTPGGKRSRDDEDDGADVDGDAGRFDKKARPGSGGSDAWPQDSVLNTPTASLSHYTYQKPKYDSDDQSSMMSEPGSPQDITMSTDDEDMLDEPLFSQSQPSSSSPWQARMLRHEHRVPTPIVPPIRPGSRAMQTSTRQHIRQRHPQENISNSSDLLEVPSPIDEDDMPTPPSAAEAAGSQLSMLTVNDMEVETVNNMLLPSISIDRSETLPLPQDDDGGDMDSAITDDGFMADGREPRLIVRKQRQRSGALSSGQGSPVRPEQAMRDLVKRGLSIGYRPDCEKCRMRVPGHMNHFVS